VTLPEIRTSLPSLVTLAPARTGLYGESSGAFFENHRRLRDPSRLFRSLLITAHQYDLGANEDVHGAFDKNVSHIAMGRLSSRFVATPIAA